MAIRALGRDPLGARRTIWDAGLPRLAGRYAGGLESGDDGGHEGMPRGHVADERGRDERGCGEERRLPGRCRNVGERQRELAL